MCDKRTDGPWTNRIYHPFVQGQENPQKRLAESWKLHIFDTRVDFPVPVQSGG